MVLPRVVFDWLWYCLSMFSWFFLMLHWIDCDIVYLCSHGSSSCCIVLIVTVFICVLWFFLMLHWIDCDIVYLFPIVLPPVALDWKWHCFSLFLWFCLMLHWIHCYIFFLCSYGSSSFCIWLIVILFFCVLMVLPHVALNWLWYCFSVFSRFFLMLHWIDCDIVYLCSYGFSSCCIGLIAILFTYVFMVLPHAALDWLWYRFSVFSWFFVMLLLIYCDIVYLCSHGSSSCCIGLIVALFICVLMVLPHVALDWLWQYLSVFLWVFLMLHLIECDIVYLCSHGSSSCCIGFIVALFICVLTVLSHVAVYWLWHCLSVFSWFFLMLPWIDCDIVYLCSYESSSCCIGLILTLFICVLMFFFLMLHWIDCDIVYLCSYGSSSFCIGLNVTLFICVFMVLPHVALDWLWHCLSVFLWFFLVLHWIDCDIVYLCFHGSSSCCIWLIVTLFIYVLMVLLHVALNWLWYCYSVFSWFFLMLPWIDCDIVFSVFSWFFVMMRLINCDIVHLCSHGSSSCCIELIVTLFICVLMVLPHDALDWLWYCLSVFSWFLLMLQWIDCDSIYLCSYGSSLCCIWLIVTLYNGSSSCCIGLIVTLFFSVLMVPPDVALDWLWHCLSVFLWVFLMLHWIDCDIVYLYFHGSSSCCLGLIVTLFICVLMGLPYVALEWFDIVYLCTYRSSSCCIGLIVTLFICVCMVLPHVLLYWLWYCFSVFLWFYLMLHWIDCDIVNLCSRASSSCCIWLWHC